MQEQAGIVGGFFFSEEMEEGVSRETCLESASLINADLKKKKKKEKKKENGSKKSALLVMNIFL